MGTCVSEDEEGDSGQAVEEPGGEDEDVNQQSQITR